MQLSGLGACKSWSECPEPHQFKFFLSSFYFQDSHVRPDCLPKSTLSIMAEKISWGLLGVQGQGKKV